MVESVAERDLYTKNMINSSSLSRFLFSFCLRPPVLSPPTHSGGRPHLVSTSWWTTPGTRESDVFSSSGNEEQTLFSSCNQN